jgi:activator of HSP90 ATPase
MKPKLTIIKQKVVIPATPDEVYDAYIDPKKHAEFTGSKATMSPRVGGKFTAWDDYISGRNLELEKGKKIVQEWVTSEWPQDYPPSRLELTFKEVGGNTELTLVQSDVPAEQANELEEGWTDFYWKPLKAYFKKKKRPS